ncbi:Acetyltransferase (GNAT) domain-containing protein [Sinosporangium album]|uniref:Acetyltransferase (GNAT) domain-containing protein n=1 Tax=Sinosporangium album TaxID=504805 RepID=A0A1G7YRT0_9ACTN|nr:GNAT family N-acetyltransferase [Sinosporangium album]SDG99134.1 Acetyltransferase (GNAT) domain-containing protein [Sinosporangium album]
MAQQYRRHDGQGLAPMSAEISDLYRRCYGAPPWSETAEQLDAFPAKLAAVLDRPGFAAWTARDGSGRLAGLCYGWPTPADLGDNRVYDSLIQAFGLPATADLTRGAFEVAELFVRPDSQGRGIGRHLLTRATASWPTAWLLTSPQTPAARLYTNLGWHEVGPLAPEWYPGLRLSLYTWTSPAGSVSG